jgi:hypothetical protein
VAERLRQTGAQQLILVHDTDSATLNGSSAGQDGIALTSFSIELYLDGELVTATIATLQASPYFLTIDNIGQGKYKLNITLATAGFYELWVKHSTGMIAWRQEALDLQKTLEELLSIGEENVSFEFVRAGSVIAARKVAVGMLDQVIIKRKRKSDTNWSSPLQSGTLFAHYETLGDENPQFMKEGP